VFFQYTLNFPDRSARLFERVIFIDEMRFRLLSNYCAPLSIPVCRSSPTPFFLQHEKSTPLLLPVLHIFQNIRPDNSMAGYSHAEGGGHPGRKAPAPPTAERDSCQRRQQHSDKRKQYP
jgi:hypothetical protein